MTPAVLVLSLALGQLSAAEAPRPSLLQDLKVEQRLGAQVPLAATFTDSTGREVRLGDTFGGKPVILVLAYYECPMLCTLVLSGAVRAMNVLSLGLGRDYRAVTLSIDPRDTAALAAKKRDSHLAALRVQPERGGGDPWPFLVGREPEIRAVADAVGFRYAFDAASGQYAHASAIMVLTPDGRVSRYLYGVDYSARDLRLALVEAGGGAVGTLADEILLQCFRYDPALGRYSVAVLGTVRLLGGLTFLLLAGYVGVSLWRDRRRRSPIRRLDTP